MGRGAIGGYRMCGGVTVVGMGEGEGKDLLGVVCQQSEYTSMYGGVLVHRLQRRGGWVLGSCLRTRFVGRDINKGHHLMCIPPCTAREEVR